MALNIEEEKKKKGKVGRPRKNPEIYPVKTNGIVDKPIHADNVMELTYHNPQIFKKLVTLFKSLNISEIPMIFTEKGIQICTMDHKKKSTIYIDIDGSKMGHYFCKERLDVGIKREYIEKIFQIIDKSYYYISFVSKENEKKSTLFVQLKNSDMDNEEKYKIELIRPSNLEITHHDDIDYPIKFVLSTKHFRKIVNDYASMTRIFYIEIEGNGPLQFTYSKDRKVNMSSCYTNKNKINLVNSLTEDDLFSASICIDYIKPITRSLLSNNVYISVDKYKPIMFMTKSEDGMCTIKIFTELYSNIPIIN